MCVLLCAWFIELVLENQEISRQVFTFETNLDVVHHAGIVTLLSLHFFCRIKRP